MTHRSSCERALSKPTSPACLRWSPGFSLVEGATSPARESPGASGAAAPTCEPERTEAGLAPRTGLLWLQHSLSIGFSRFWRLKRLPTPGLESRPWEVLGGAGANLGPGPSKPPRGVPPRPSVPPLQSWKVVWVCLPPPRSEGTATGRRLEGGRAWAWLVPRPALASSNKQPGSADSCRAGAVQ